MKRPGSMWGSKFLCFHYGITYTIMWIYLVIDWKLMYILYNDWGKNILLWSRGRSWIFNWLKNDLDPISSSTNFCTPYWWLQAGHICSCKRSMLSTSLYIMHAGIITERIIKAHQNKNCPRMMLFPGQRQSLPLLFTFILYCISLWA